LQYRQVGNTGVDVSALGFGTMRFKDKDNAAQTIQYGLPLGITYFDIGSAYSYKSFDDNAETWTGAAIAGVPRDKMVLSAKAQPRHGEPKVDIGLGINTRDDMWRCMENSLKRVGVEWFDFYQLWDMSADDHFEAACVGADTPLQAMREARDQGLVKHLGFTTHASPDCTISYLEQVPDFRFVTIYYNFNDRGPEKVLDYAGANGVGTCIMGPLRGGILTGMSDAFSQALPEFDGAPVQEVALRFLMANPAVSTVISGMNAPEQVDQNARIADLQAPMTADQRRRFIEAFDAFTHGTALCSGCRYCAGSCPQGLAVPEAMSAYQLYEVFGLHSTAGSVARFHADPAKDPANCNACGTCVEKCPQKLPIPERMERLAELAAELHAAQGQ
jgi:uncharacterized protein